MAKKKVYEEKYKHIVDKIKRSGELDWLISGDEDREYFYLDGFGMDDNDRLVHLFLEEAGYDVFSYKDGLAIKKGGKKKLRIGAIINRVEKNELKKIESQSDNTESYDNYINLRGVKEFFSEIRKNFETSPYRLSSKKLMVVISKNRHDIAKMSTDRGWMSCFSFEYDEDEDHEYILEEIRDGGLVAYLTTSGDNNIEDPLARISIRRLEAIGSNQSIACVEKEIYGVYIPAFLRAVENWIFKKQKKIPRIAYVLRGADYSDSLFSDHNYYLPEDLTIDELIEIFYTQDPYKVTGEKVRPKVKFSGYLEDLMKDMADEKMRKRIHSDAYSLTILVSDFTKEIDKSIAKREIYRLNLEYKSGVEEIFGKQIWEYGNTYLYIDDEGEAQKFKHLQLASVKQVAIERILQRPDLDVDLIGDIARYAYSLINSGKYMDMADGDEIIRFFIETGKTKYLSSHFLKDYIARKHRVYGFFKLQDSKYSGDVCAKAIEEIIFIKNNYMDFFFSDYVPFVGRGSVSHYYFNLYKFLQNLETLSRFCRSIPEPTIRDIIEIIERTKVNIKKDFSPLKYIKLKEINYPAIMSEAEMLLPPDEIMRIGAIKTFINSNTKSNKVISFLLDSLFLFDRERELILNAIINMEEDSIYFYDFILEILSKIENNVPLEILKYNKKRDKLIEKEYADEARLIIDNTQELRVLYESLKHTEYFILNSHKRYINNPFKYSPGHISLDTNSLDTLIAFSEKYLKLLEGLQ